jgi:uncharacterized membrane protein
MSFHEHHSRSWTKAVTYRILIIISNGLIVYVYTGEWRTTVDVMSISSVISTLIYFFHERAWNRIRWGRHHINKK